MVQQTADKAALAARSYGTCVPGYCLKYTRTWLDIPSRDDWAVHSFERAMVKHSGDRNPPRGAPVMWAGGSHGYGHIALAMMPIKGVARIRTTDVPHSGIVSTVELSYIEQHWGFRYLGWTEDLNGITIPYLSNAGKEEDTAESERELSPWYKGDVYMSKLHVGQEDSDSVRRLQFRLRQLVHGGTPDQPLTGNFYTRTVISTRRWQNVLGGDGPKDGRSINLRQANAIFGDKYTIHEA